jgi:hypothetical protein
MTKVNIFVMLKEPLMKKLHKFFNTIKKISIEKTPILEIWASTNTQNLK